MSKSRYTALATFFGGDLTTGQFNAAEFLRRLDEYLRRDRQEIERTLDDMQAQIDEIAP